MIQRIPLEKAWRYHPIFIKYALKTVITTKVKVADIGL